MLSLIEENLKSVLRTVPESDLKLPPPRHLFLRIEGSIIVEMIYSQVKELAPLKVRDKIKLLS